MENIYASSITFSIPSFFRSCLQSPILFSYVPFLIPLSYSSSILFPFIASIPLFLPRPILYFRRPSLTFSYPCPLSSSFLLLLFPSPLPLSIPSYFMPCFLSSYIVLLRPSLSHSIVPFISPILRFFFFFQVYSFIHCILPHLPIC